MKKIIFLTLLIFFPCIINAECDYKTEKNITSLSLYVDYSYEYIEEDNAFNIYIYNLQNIFGVSYNGKTYFKNQDDIVVIDKIPLGTNIELSIFSTETECSGKLYRTISFILPFLNPYYNSNECVGYDHLAVCYSRFLNFEISYNTFKNTIKREEASKNQIENKTNIFEEVIKFLKNNYIKISIVLVVTVIGIIISKNKYRKRTHGF